ncbi:hypothetical protein [Paraliobacillus salinarum]|uniref:hypothetical protein n=1 Tax=Paraliobacillus salinarum TaxID=1158996 RepID=UPI0015F72692|nr:hypothetical protein [Paraliobacillus salinarum]
MDNKIKKEMQKIEIPETLHQRIKLGVSQAKKERPFINKRLNKKVLAFAAVLFLSIGAFALLNMNQDGNDTANQPFATEDGGVGIPPIQLPEEGANADMIGLIVYNERIYTQTSSEVNLKTAENMLGEKLGTTKGTIDEWSKQEAYDQEFASTIGETDVYTVKGYSKDFRIMTYRKDKDGQIHSEFYENLNGITIQNGEDFFTKLNMKGNITSATYQLFSDWDQGLENYHSITDMKAVNAFVSELYQTDVHPRSAQSDPINEARNDASFRKLILQLADGTTVKLTLLKDGYIYYGFMDAYFEMNDKAFREIWNIIEET